ncbi:monovalent cation/H+ antiporter subunit D [Sphingomonas sp. IC-11]|uniref:monovalent cation/H+ antiporter subunit D n=1 Tax=Sphingomonas sp. IC-11 TaxID=2898528 RepID=UPI001E28B8A3|nr:monovalent cation/H+ antiporter subunit D [Sphingomonas sp. IC-11]MCD2317050.1 monovalent cation/H+ antiporter subunit D [Sphingomonas sp. IC-11]
MSALIAAPVLLPAFAGVATLLFRRRRRWIGAGMSIGATAVLLVIGVALLVRATTGEVSVYALGDWPAPFGIVLVLDRLAAMMLVLTAALALAVGVHATLTGLDRRGWHFHPLFQFQLLGINGAFLTGDLFNLFVFFEVLLIASYGLLLHGQGARRLTAGVQYVIVNLVGSTLFLIALGLLYGITGTLNMADMAVRGAALGAGDQGLFRAGGMLLMAVFALKAALLPLHLWLPRAYAGAAPAVAALFAIMTKVGAYAIIRTGPLIFAGAAGRYMVPAALATMILGFAGFVAARHLRSMAAFGLIGSTAILLTAVALFEEGAMAAALYYLPHTTIAAALLFLVADLVMRWRGAEGDSIVSTGAYQGRQLVAFLFFAAGVALAGLPPLSGFIGKLFILDAALRSAWWPAIWAVILGTSLVAVIALARGGSTLFWKRGTGQQPAVERTPPALLEAAPAGFLLALLGMLTIGAGPVTAYMEATSRQIFSTAAYIGAVLPARPGTGA